MGLGRPDRRLAILRGSCCAKRRFSRGSSSSVRRRPGTRCGRRSRPSISRKVVGFAPPTQPAVGAVALPAARGPPPALAASIVAIPLARGALLVDEASPGASWGGRASPFIPHRRESKAGWFGLRGAVRNRSACARIEAPMARNLLVGSRVGSKLCKVLDAAAHAEVSFRRQTDRAPARQAEAFQPFARDR